MKQDNSYMTLAQFRHAYDADVEIFTRELASELHARRSLNPAYVAS